MYTIYQKRIKNTDLWSYRYCKERAILAWHLYNAALFHIRQIFTGWEKESRTLIAPDYNITLEEWNHDVDHVHILFRGQPNTEISRFINAYKSASSRLVKRDHPEIKPCLWKGMFWPQSFCLLTTGGVTTDIVSKYIQSQGMKHGK